MSGRVIVFLVIAMVFLPVAAQADSCTPTEAYDATQINGEVAGQHQYAENLDHGWTFLLRPAPHGWDIEVWDESGYNLALATLPLYGDNNPRMLYGWHFRNAANTGPNEGDVNAPQLERRFALNDPREGAFRSAGLGWLNILDYGLADLEPGARARMVYLRFDACVLTPRTAEEQAQEAHLASPVYLDEEMEMIRSCGLELSFRPEAWVMPRMLGGDFDADGAHDFAVPVVREDDGQHAIAICRAGTWLDVFGADDVPSGSDLTPQYFNQVEAWRAGPRETLPQYVGDAALPAGPGDALTIERIEKSAYSIYWDGEAFRSHHHYTMIEP